MEHIVDAFSESKRWSKIVGIILAITLAIQSIAIIANFFFVSITSKGETIDIFIAATFPALASLNLFASICLIRYSGSVSTAEIAIDPTEDIELACKHQGRYFKFANLAALLLIITITTFISATTQAYNDYTMRAQNVRMQMQQFD